MYKLLFYIISHNSVYFLNKKIVWSCQNMQDKLQQQELVSSEALLFTFNRKWNHTTKTRQKYYLKWPTELGGKDMF